MENWVNNTDDENVASWIGQLVKHFSGSISNEENLIMNDLENKDDADPADFEVKWNPHDQENEGLFLFHCADICYKCYV